MAFFLNSYKLSAPSALTDLFHRLQGLNYKLVTLHFDLLKLQSFIDSELCGPLAISTLRDAIAFVESECTVPPSTCSHFEATVYLTSYEYCHRILQIVRGHLGDIDIEVNAADQEYRKLNNEGRLWIIDVTDAISEDLVEGIDNLMWDVKQLQKRLWGAISNSRS